MKQIKTVSYNEQLISHFSAMFRISGLARVVARPEMLLLVFKGHGPFFLFTCFP